MPNSSKRRGDRAELEVQGLWRDHTGIPARRALGAGRLDDMGDIAAIPHTVCQVANRKDLAQAVRHKPLEAERQREQAHVTFACTFLRIGGTENGEPAYRIILTPEQFFALWREATQ